MQTIRFGLFDGSVEYLSNQKYVGKHIHNINTICVSKTTLICFIVLFSLVYMRFADRNATFVTGIHSPYITCERILINKFFFSSSAKLLVRDRKFKNTSHFPQ